MNKERCHHNIVIYNESLKFIGVQFRNFSEIKGQSKWKQIVTLKH